MKNKEAIKKRADLRKAKKDRKLKKQESEAKMETWLNMPYEQWTQARKDHKELGDTENFN